MLTIQRINTSTVCLSFQFQKISHDLASVFSQDALRMELDAPDRIIPMPDAHDLTFGSLGRHFQKIRQRGALNDQRMVASRVEWIWHPQEQILPIVPDR